ncbi:MAG: hypothetical protein ACI4WY_04415 [Anaerovoracaceae bacterium]
MAKCKPNYLKSIVIVHGKSEKQICDYIKSNLRLHMEVISKDNGENSIQINSLKHILYDRRFKTIENFIEHFDDVEIVRKGKKKSFAPYFKIFIIMDTDDCNANERKKYITKEMFASHWAKDIIVPIFNSPELESVLTKAGIKFEKKGVERKKEYIKIFPTDKKYSARETIEIDKFCKDLKKVECTNMEEFIEHCLSLCGLGG